MTPCLLAVHAHPDDESITMGGTLARYSAAGVRVVLVTATLGEEGEIIPVDLQGLAADAGNQLGGYRWWELSRACEALGVGEHRLLGGTGAFRDSGMVGTASTEHPRAFVRARTGGPDHDRAVELLTAIIDEVRPQVLLTYAADGGYGHPDHLATHEVAMTAGVGRVARTLAVVRPKDVVQDALSELVVPAGLRAAEPDDLGYLVDPGAFDVAVEVAAHDAQRRSALAAHATQLRLVADGFALTNLIAQPLLGAEYYQLLAGRPMPTGRPAGDLFAGL